MNDTGLKSTIINAIRLLAQSNGLDKVILFGSRSKGTFYPKSDIDLAVSGGNCDNFALDIEEEIPTLLRFDCINLDGPLSQSFRDAILEEGKLIYEKI